VNVRGRWVASDIPYTTTINSEFLCYAGKYPHFSRERKVRKTSHQEHIIGKQNERNGKAIIHAQAHALVTTLIAEERG
jgi:hypothetical protein